VSDVTVTISGRPYWQMLGWNGGTIADVSLFHRMQCPCPTIKSWHPSSWHPLQTALQEVTSCFFCAARWQTRVFLVSNKQAQIVATLLRNWLLFIATGVLLDASRVEPNAESAASLRSAKCITQFNFRTGKIWSWGKYLPWLQNNYRNGVPAPLHHCYR